MIFLIVGVIINALILTAAIWIVTRDATETTFPQKCLMALGIEVGALIIFLLIGAIIPILWLAIILGIVATIALTAWVLMKWAYLWQNHAIIVAVIYAILRVVVSFARNAILG